MVFCNIMFARLFFEQRVNIRVAMVIFLTDSTCMLVDLLKSANYLLIAEKRTAFRTSIFTTQISKYDNCNMGRGIPRTSDPFQGK
jgi:hypothetical protein